MYRMAADESANQLIDSRVIDPAWRIPIRSVAPDSRSRNAMINDEDCGPKPPDDPAAEHLLRHPYRFHNHKYWDQIPVNEQIENPLWLEYLPRSDEGHVRLTPELAMDLALLHNRDFQSQYEQVYLSALQLTGNRFEFDTQWTGGTATDFNASGDGGAASRLLNVSDRLGFQRNLAAGGQFATQLVNSFVFEFGGGQFNQASGSVVATFTQPLLRGAFRYVRLESLSQSERELLYQVRDFARFRREFYLSVISRYYSLLAQLQSIRNLRVNLESLELNLEEHEELLARKMVSQIQVDQVFQDYQSGRINLFSAEQGLANSLDAFKFLLGLPPWVDIQFDESLLESFEFTSADIEVLDGEVERLYTKLLEYLPPARPTIEELQQRFSEYQQLRQTLHEQTPVVKAELLAWIEKLEANSDQTLNRDDQIDRLQQLRLAQSLQSRIEDLEISLADNSADLAIAEAVANYRPDQLPDQLIEEQQNEQPNGIRNPLRDRMSGDAWRLLLDAVARRLREQVSELYVAQSQTRLFSLEVESLDVEQSAAVNFAYASRLDLMNARGRLADSYRRVEIAANALESELNVLAGANLNTDPTRDNPMRFDSSANRYQVGVQFDGPLNRLNERNAYRAAQISYQQSRRQFLATEDAIANAIRADLRALKISRLNFQIARQQYVAATRQVDEAKFNLRTTNTANSNLTRDLLTALQGLLGAKNNLISNWVDYKVAKIQLFTDLELLYLDEEGQWINEAEGLQALPATEQPPIESESAENQTENDIP